MGLLLALSLATSAALGSGDELSDGIGLYDDFQPELAIRVLSKVAGDAGAPAVRRAQAAVYLAMSHAALGDLAAAKADLVAAYEQDPSLRLPKSAPPELAELAKQAKSEAAAEKERRSAEAARAEKAAQVAAAEKAAEAARAEQAALAARAEEAARAARLAEQAAEKARAEQAAISARIPEPAPVTPPAAGSATGQGTPEIPDPAPRTFADASPSVDPVQPGPASQAGAAPAQSAIVQQPGPGSQAGVADAQSEGQQPGPASQAGAAPAQSINAPPPPSSDGTGPVASLDYAGATLGMHGRGTAPSEPPSIRRPRHASGLLLGGFLEVGIRVLGSPGDARFAPALELGAGADLGPVRIGAIGALLAGDALAFAIAARVTTVQKIASIPWLFGIDAGALLGGTKSTLSPGATAHLLGVALDLGAVNVRLRAASVGVYAGPTGPRLTLESGLGVVF